MSKQGSSIGRLAAWSTSSAGSKWLLLAIVGLALALRLNHLDADAHGDGAIYYFLTRHWGEVPGDPTLLQEFVRRPLMFVLYHPFAWSLESFRLANIVVGASLPLLVLWLLRGYGVDRRWALLGALLIALNKTLVQFSNFVVPDMLGAFFALLMLGFYQRGRYGTSAVMLLLATLTKEYFAIAGLAMLLIVFVRKRFGWQALAYAAALLPVTALSLIDLWGLGARWMGWSISGMSWVVFNASLLSLPLAPFYLLLAPSRRWAELVLLGVYPAFYLAWRFILKEGIDDWYAILPATLAVTFLCLLFSDILGSRLTFLGSARARRVLVGVVACFAVVYSIASVSLYEVRWHERDARDMAEYIAAAQPAATLLVIDDFWGYGYYPFGEVAATALLYTGRAEAGDVLERMKQYDLVLVRKRDIPANLQVRQAPGLVLETGKYVLLRPSPE